MFNYLRNSKYTSKKINKIYSEYLYTGLHGVLMRYCHRQLECKLPERNFKKILEKERWKGEERRIEEKRRREGQREWRRREVLFFF